MTDRDYIELLLYMAVILGAVGLVLLINWLDRWSWRHQPRHKPEPVSEPTASTIQRLQLDSINKMKEAGVHITPPTLRQLVAAGQIQHPGEEVLVADENFRAMLVSQEEETL